MQRPIRLVRLAVAVTPIATAILALTNEIQDAIQFHETVGIPTARLCQILSMDSLPPAGLLDKLCRPLGPMFAVLESACEAPPNSVGKPKYVPLI
jgi:hypothetical protein